MEAIEPESFDLVVVGSGLPEAVLACAAAKAGRSVLLVDSEEFYGGPWSSVSWDTFQGLLASQSDGASATAAASKFDALGVPEDARLQQLTSPFRVLSRATLTSDHSIQHESKYFIVDLNPKVLYQGEQLVNAMVKCNVHNYIEFKMIEGSFIYQQGALKPVPASKSDVFKTRDLTLLEKRSLMQFLNSILAPAGSTPAPPSTTSTTPTTAGPPTDVQAPLADLLAAAMLPPRLQDAVLYGIAVADAPQPPLPPQPQRPADSASAGQAGVSTAASAAADAPGAGAMASARAGTVPEDVGRAAVRLYMESLGKYGGKGAFMAPLYGCGSIVEGFIRAAAVGGAVTVLRHPLQGLVIQPGTPDRPEEGVCTGLLTAQGQLLQCKQLVASAAALRNLLPPTTTPATMAASRNITSRAVAVLDAPLQPGLASSTVVLPPTDACPNPVRALQLGSNTCVTQAGRFLLYLATPATSDSAMTDLLPALSSLACTSHLRAPGASCTNDTPTPSSTSPAVATATDPEQQPEQQQDDQPSSTTAAAATSPGLATAADAATEPTGAQSACSTGTQVASGEAPARAEASSGQTAAEGPANRGAAAGSAAGMQAESRLSASGKSGTTEAGGLPRVLHVEFYQQELVDGAELAGCLPSNVVCCSDAEPFMMGFVAAFQQCEVDFRRHFPDVRWVTDVDEAAEAQVPLDDDEDMALEDLSSAVKEISAAQEAPVIPAAAAGEAAAAAAGAGEQAPAAAADAPAAAQEGHAAAQ